MLFFIDIGIFLHRNYNKKGKKNYIYTYKRFIIIEVQIMYLLFYQMVITLVHIISKEK